MAITAIVVTVVGVGALVGTPQGRRALKTAGSLITSGCGFVSNATHDLCTSCGSDAGKRKSWDSTVKSLKEFLVTSGVMNELLQSSNDPLVYKVRLLDKIQKRLPISRREEIKMMTPCETPPLEEAAHFMRFATAVYGPEMISSVRIKLGKTPLVHKTANQVRMIHTGVESPDAILTADISYGGNVDCLRYAVVVDHEKKAVVLAVRGTFSISEIFTDIEGYSTPFCGGEAHAGVAKMARAVWEKASTAVRKKVESLPYNDLVILGHSLGAAAASLITIMLYHDKKLLPPNIKVRCMAYAPVPVFYPLEQAREAQANTVGYVYNTDWVPSLSGNSLRQLNACLNDLDEANSGLSWLEKREIYCGVIDPPEHLIETIQNTRDKRLSDIEGAPLMAIPARAIVWLKENGEGGYYPVVCDPIAYAKWGIYVDINMATDHFPPMYERAFDWLLEHWSYV